MQTKVKVLKILTHSTSTSAMVTTQISYVTNNISSIYKCIWVAHMCWWFTSHVKCLIWVFKFVNKHMIIDSCLAFSWTSNFQKHYTWTWSSCLCIKHRFHLIEHPSKSTNLNTSLNWLNLIKLRIDQRQLRGYGSKPHHNLDIMKEIKICLCFVIVEPINAHSH
jgi:hypothetical protein